MKIAIVNDQPYYSGMGKYAHKLYERLKDKVPMDYFFLDYKSRSLRNQNDAVIAQDKKFPLLDNKPFFWHRMRDKLPSDGIYHFANQNLSFLVSGESSIVTCHDLAPLILPDNPLEKLWRRYLYNGLKKATLVFADSFSTKNDLIKIYSLPEQKIEVVYLGVEPEQFRPIENKPGIRKKLNLPLTKKIIVNVGTEKRRKNVTGLLRAFSKLAGNNKDVLLLRIGKVQRKTRKLINELNIKDHVDCRENIGETDLPYFYNAADVCIMPSFYEGFGLPALEAMSCGTPTIVGNTSSLPEIVDDAALKIDPYSIEGMFKTMEKLITETTLQAELREKGIARAKKFNWDSTAGQVAAHYSRFLV